jgi:hypothetical protein
VINIIKSSAAAAGLSLLVAGAASGADDQSDRYSMSPTEGGFVRLDKETGAMSFCAKKDGAWSCDAMPDSQQAMRSEIEKLEAEKKALKEENERLAQANRPDGGSSDATPPPAPPGNLQMPTEEEVDKLFDYVEGMVRKFKERIQRLEKEAQKETPL